MEDTLRSVLQSISDNYPELLYDRQKLVAAFGDFAPNLRREKKIIQAFVMCDGVDILCNAKINQVTTEELKTVIDGLVQRMYNEECISINYAYAVCSAYTMCIGLKDKEESEKRNQLDSDYEYETIEDGTIGLKKYIGKSMEITIPDYLHGLRVTRILKGAFKDNQAIVKVKIANTVTSIGKYAFYNCTALEKVIMPSDVTVIEENAFYGCCSLADIHIPSHLISIGRLAFYKCKSIRSLILPSCLETIGNNAFSGCSGLIEVSIPGRIKSLGNSVFAKCSKLKKVAFEDGNISIGMYAFSHCSKLTEITFSSTLTTIIESAFNHCNSLITVTLPDGIKTIGRDAFWQCYNLHRINLPSSIESIGYGAFNDCNKDITAIVNKGSYAESYCQKNTIQYCYSEIEGQNKTAKYCSLPNKSVTRGKPLSVTIKKIEYVSGICPNCELRFTYNNSVQYAQCPLCLKVVNTQIINHSSVWCVLSEKHDNSQWDQPEKYRIQAYRGDSDAQFHWAQFLLNRTTVYDHLVKSDTKGKKEEYQVWIEKAASQGHRLSQLWLQREKNKINSPNNSRYSQRSSKLYGTSDKKERPLVTSSFSQENNIPNPIPHKTDDEEWKDAISQLSVEDLLEVGQELLYGNNGTAKNPKQAFNCFMQAAQKGNVYAMRQLAKCYREGVGVIQNNERSRIWANMAQEEEKRQHNSAIGNYRTHTIEEPLTRAVSVFPLAYDPTNPLRPVLEGKIGVKKNGELFSLYGDKEYIANISRINSFHHDIVSVSDYAFLKKDGTVVYYWDYAKRKKLFFFDKPFYHDTFSKDDWSTIIAVVSTWITGEIYGLKTDGTVIGFEGNGNVLDVSEWKDIIKLIGRNDKLIGIRQDGSIVATSHWNNDVLDELYNFRSIDTVSIGSTHVLGLQKDGRVVTGGFMNSKRGEEAMHLDDWADIIAVAAGSEHSVGLKADGTVVAKGSNKFGQCDVNDWKDIIAIQAGSSWTAGISKNGILHITTLKSLQKKMTSEVIRLF